ncbi:hypothetical protein HDU89_008777 [Geranomyces variabilis]|nr:hypothetical protein HDU89_008777 [Geranomyces variabilis]
MNTHVDDDESDEDELFRELERDDDTFLAVHREQRIDELKREMAKLEEARVMSHGTYETIATEKELMDTHLEALARLHPKTRFVRIDVENAPFLVEKLKVQVLPCVVPFIDGVSVDRLVGFELVGDADNVPTKNVEIWLRNTKVLDPPVLVGRAARKGIFGFPNSVEREDGSDDDY